MIRILVANIVTYGLVLWAHQSPTIGGRVPMVFVATWFGSAVIVAMVFLMKHPGGVEGVEFAEEDRRRLWRQRMRISFFGLLPLAFVPLVEMRGVSYDPAVCLLDAALFISVCTVPYFTLVARTIVGGVVLSMMAFQILWILGACILFRVMQQSLAAKGEQIGKGAAFEEFFRHPDYRYLFYILCAVMLLGYCPLVLWLGQRRFFKQFRPRAASLPVLEPHHG
jgi:hypothetical protein